MKSFQFGHCKSHSINSGTYIGYVKFIRNLLEQISKNYDLNKHKDDQVILTQMCNKYDDISIDLDRRLFLVTSYLDGNLQKLFIKNNQLFLNNVNPCILHAPANTNIYHILKDLGYQIHNRKRRNNEHLLYEQIFLFIIKYIYMIIIFIIFIIFIIIVAIYNFRKKLKQRK